MEEENGEEEEEEEIGCATAGLKMKGLHGKECEQCLGADSSPQLTASKEVETSVLQQQGTKFC